jgi:hypothetical protein
MGKVCARVRVCARAYLRGEVLIHAFIFSLLFSCLLPDLSRLFTSASLWSKYAGI